MNTNASFTRKLSFLFLTLIMMFASLPVSSVLAASGNDEQPWESVDLEKEWKNKLRLLHYEGFFYNRVRLDPDDFERATDFTQAQIYLDKYGFAFRQANTVVYNHTGFDYRGEVTDEKQAYESIHNLAMYLQMMRGFKDKIEEL